MHERQIPFKAAMVRAVLAGTKTQTRRAWRVQPPAGVQVAYVPGETRCPYGQPGDRLWVRETWYCDDYRVQSGPYLKPDDLDPSTMVYRASSGDRPFEAEQPVWRPSIHMPRWASRILLEVTGVRVERLQDISETDAIAEGVTNRQRDGVGMYFVGAEAAGTTAVGCYQQLWESINGPGSWDANPWVWVVEFRRLA